MMHLESTLANVEATMGPGTYGAAGGAGAGGLDAADREGWNALRRVWGAAAGRVRTGNRQAHRAAGDWAGSKSNMRESMARRRKAYGILRQMWRTVGRQ